MSAQDQSRAELFLFLICRFDERFRQVSREDAIGECLLASLEYPDDFREAIRYARRRLNPLLSHKLRVLPYYDNVIRGREKKEPSALEKWAEQVIQDYIETDFPAIAEKYRIPDTRAIRKALSEIAPKPDEANKPHGKTVKVDCVGKSRDDLVAEGLNRITAWRAAKRGYYYKPVK